MSIETFAVNLKSRIDRREHIVAEFKLREEFNLTIIDAVEHKVGAVGLWESIRKIIAIALERKLSLLLICEDDHQFTEHYSFELLQSSIIKAQEYQADILSGGVSWFQTAIPASENLIGIELFSGTQFIIVFQKFFRQILNATFSEADSADLKICSLTDRKFVISPFISTQRDFGYSDVTAINDGTQRIDQLFKSASFNINNLKRIFYQYNNSASHVYSNLCPINVGTVSIPTYIINLQNRTERLAHIKGQFKGRPEFDIEIVTATEHSNGAVGLWMSIRNVVQLAIANDDDVIVICEDDHSFLDNYSADAFFETVIFAQRLGVKYLSGGCSHFENPLPITHQLFWVLHCLATQFIIIYKPAFDVILNEPFDETVTADKLLSKLFPDKMVIYPPISTQKDFGYSDVTALHNEQKNLVNNMFAQTRYRLDIINRMGIEFNCFAK